MNDQPTQLRTRAESLLRQGRPREAIDIYRRLFEVDPGLGNDWYNFGYLLKAEGQFEAALDAYSQSLARGVSEPAEVHLNRAVILSDHLRREDEAQAVLEAALAANPDYVPALLNLGNLWEERGDHGQAISLYERVLSIGKDDDVHGGLRYEALGRLAHLRPPSGPDDPLLGQLARAATDNDELDTTTRANLLFSLGRAFDGLGEYDKAFAAFEQANKLARTTGGAYRAGRARRQTDGLMAAFGRSEGIAAGATAKAAPEPVFICGMFRSGSTLVEQALSAHPRVISGGELEFFPRLASRLPDPFPASAAKLDEQQAATLAGGYRAHLQRLFHASGDHGMYVTDKRPDNFRLIGLIKRLFPAARIVHTVRNPLDTCLSIYFQHLAQKALSYSSDLAATGHYYGEYQRLMAHWKTLYGDEIFDFDYDAFVRHPKPNLEKLLEYLELDWDDRCLEFHRLSNPVKTASYRQVRRPLYTEASGRWRNYRERLGPLRAALRQAGVETDSD